MKTFSERSPVVIGFIGIVAVVAVALAALNYQKLPFFNQGRTYSAEFADAGGLFTGAAVEVSGFPSGKVSSIELDGNRVLVNFWVDKNIHVGERSEARIRAKSLLGTKVLEVLPRGDDTLVDTIPIDRTTSPYQLPDALGDLASTIGGLNTDQLSESLATLAQTFSDTPEELRTAVAGGGAVRADPQRARRQPAQAARQRGQGDGCAGRAHRPGGQPGARHQCAAGGAAYPKRGAGSGLAQRLGRRAAAQGLHRREPTGTAAGAGQAQRPADDRRQPQGARATGDQRPQHLRHGAWGIDLLGPLLQGIRRQPAARSVRSTLHRRRVLRPGTGSIGVAAVAAD